MAMIQDLAVGDTIDLAGVDDGDAGIADGAFGAALTLGAGATLANYLDAAAADTTDTGGGTAALDVSIASHFQFEGNTYIVVDNNTAATFTSGGTINDSVIQIAGLVDLEGDVFNFSINNRIS